MKLFKQLLKKYSEKVYFWSIKGEIIDQPATRQEEKSKVFNFLDGATLTVEKTNYKWYTSSSERVHDNYFYDWTTPMGEVFMLFVKDFDNIERTVDGKVTTYTHKVLGYTFSGSYNTYESLNWSSNIDSLTSNQLNKIYNVLMLYKHNDRIVQFNKLTLLRKARNEARKINKYLRTL